MLNLRPRGGRGGAAGADRVDAAEGSRRRTVAASRSPGRDSNPAPSRELAHVVDGDLAEAVREVVEALAVFLEVDGGEERHDGHALLVVALAALPGLLA